MLPVYGQKIAGEIWKVPFVAVQGDEMTELACIIIASVIFFRYITDKASGYNHRETCIAADREAKAI